MSEPDKVRFAKSVMGVVRLMSVIEQLESTATRLKSIRRQIRTLDKSDQSRKWFDVAIKTIDKTIDSLNTCSDTISLAIELMTPLTPPKPEDSPICDAECPEKL